MNRYGFQNGTRKGNHIFVYILKSPICPNEFYVGFTDDPERRFTIEFFVDFALTATVILPPQKKVNDGSY